MGPALFLMGAGSMLSAFGTQEEASASARASEYNALMADFNADVTGIKTADDVRRLRVQGRKVLGDMRASYGASGVTSEGSALDVLEESAASLERDALNLKYEGELQAANYRNSARLDRMNAEATRTSGKYAAAGQLLGGASHMARK